MNIEERETQRRLQRRFLAEAREQSRANEAALRCLQQTLVECERERRDLQTVCNDELEERGEARRERFNRDAREWAQAVAGAIAALLLFGVVVLLVVWMDR